MKLYECTVKFAKFFNYGYRTKCARKYLTFAESVDAAIDKIIASVDPRVSDIMEVAAKVLESDVVILNSSLEID